MLILLKSHVAGYTRADGTVVKPHEDKRIRHAEPHMPESQRDKLANQAYERARAHPEYQRLEGEIEAAQKASARRWAEIQAETRRRLDAKVKDSPDSAQAIVDMGERAAQRLADTVFRDDVMAEMGDPETDAWKTREQQRQFVNDFIDAAVPPASPFTDAANQARDVLHSPKFWAWFGDSKVVDSEGRPLMAFHGTGEDFDQFKVGDDARLRSGDPKNPNYSGNLGAWFAAPTRDAVGYDPGNAESMADGFMPRDKNSPNVGVYDDYAAGANTMPVYLSIKNPMEFEGFDDFQEQRDEFPSQLAFKQSMLDAGHDGIVIRDCMTDGDMPRDDWVAFDPRQIKSAIGNTEFDPESPNMTKSILFLRRP